MGANEPPKMMSGGAKEHLLDMIKKYIEPLYLYVGLTIVMGIVYVRQIPTGVLIQLNRIIGRIFLFALTLVFADMYSWTYGVIMALLAILILASNPRIEGFADTTDIKLVTNPKRWFIEEILNEHPSGVAEDKVTTTAIQDQSGSASSGSSSNSAK